MPLPQAPNNSKAAVNKQVSENIHELVHHGTKKRSRQQIVAIAIATAKGRHKNPRTGMGRGIGVSAKS